MFRTTALLYILFIACTTFGQREKLAHARDLALDFLLSQQREDGSFSDSTNALFNVWETVLVCDALRQMHTPEAETAFLKARNFLQSIENEQGLLCHNSKCKEATCVETSAYYLRLLCEEEKSTSDGQCFTLSTLQENEGYWHVQNPDVREVTNYASVTAFAVNLFETCGFADYGRKKALDFIASQQLPDGSWGQHWEYYNAPGYALWQCMEALKEEEAYRAHYTRGLAYILSSQMPDGSWFYEDPAIPNVTSAELQTALMVQCLENEKDPRFAEARTKALAFLMEHQQANGAFDGGHFPIPNARYKKSEYVLATSLALIALHTQLKNLGE